MANTTPRRKLLDLVRAIFARQHSKTAPEALDKSTHTALDESTHTAPDLSPDTSSNTRSKAQPETPLPKPPHARSAPACAIGAKGIALIKRFEGCARLRRDGQVEAYPDPATGAEPWTIGWGSTGAGLEKGTRIGPGTVWSQEQCDTRFVQDLKRYAEDVARAIEATPTSQEQFDALVSFHYNTGAIARATLTTKHKAGDYEGAAREFRRWNKAGGRTLRGLTRRRSEEERLYRSA